MEGNQQKPVSTDDDGLRPSDRGSSPSAAWWHPRRVVVVVLVLAHTMGFLSSLDALMSTRTAPGAVAWIVSLNTFPYVAVPAYWVFGRTKFQGYVIGRREGETKLHQELYQPLEQVRSYRMSPSVGAEKMLALENLAKLPLMGENSPELLVDGEMTFRSLFAGIEAARSYVLVQFYIVRDDDLGRRLKTLLEAKARDGVQVYFLFDEIGSYRLPTHYIQALETAGVEVRRFHSTRGSGNRFQHNFRNHRKVVVVDGHAGWLGGLNVGDEYLGRDPNVGHWRDTHLKITGPAVLGLQLSFVEDWHWATGAVLRLPWEPTSDTERNVPILMLPTGPGDRWETASLMMQHVIHSAQKRLWISSPYFVPDEGVLAGLKLAALRGVDVRVLIPERPDNLLAYFAAYAFIAPLLEAGVRVERYEEGFLHAKTVLVDDRLSAVGTVNLDNRSFRLNFEITAWVIDQVFAAEMEDMFEADFARSRSMTWAEIEDKPLWFRVASRAAYLMAPVL